jgi:hypothetical protein
MRFLWNNGEVTYEYPSTQDVLSFLQIGAVCLDQEDLGMALRSNGWRVSGGWDHLGTDRYPSIIRGDRVVAGPVSGTVLSIWRR